MASIIKVDTIQDATGAFEHARLVQVVSTTTGAYTSGTTVIVTDDSIPTSSEGNAFPNLDTAITPTNSSNKLLIEVDLFCGCSAAATDQMSVFQDSGSAALATTSQFQSQTNGMVQLSLAFMMAAGTTSSTTFKVRAGADGGTFAINGTSGRFFGGKGACTMTISEIRV